MSMALSTALRDSSPIKYGGNIAALVQSEVVMKEEKVKMAKVARSDFAY